MLRHWLRRHPRPLRRHRQFLEAYFLSSVLALRLTALFSPTAMLTESVSASFGLISKQATAFTTGHILIRKLHGRRLPARKSYFASGPAVIPNPAGLSRKSKMLVAFSILTPTLAAL